MTDPNDKINLLLEKLETLLKRQDEFSKEINKLKIEINNLKISETKETQEKIEQVISKKESEYTDPKTHTEPAPKSQTTAYPIKKTISSIRPQPKSKLDLEKLIGENLINKIGIVITTIGVAIGAKYSIDHNLISPLTRIILGYLVGVGLLAFGMRLKKNYENYSAVLVSGAITIMYFITYAAYSFYALIPQGLAFALMAVFTLFTVLAAIQYNKQIIAHIGLVGAYAVPFLLSEGEGKIAILFSYTAIINIGILFISFWKYWKPLYYSAFGLTWLMYFLWFTSEYLSDRHFTLALIFLSLFFLIFYTTFIAYNVRQNEKLKIDDIILLLANSFIFYGLGYVVLASDESGGQLLGVFTLCNAIIHFIVSSIIYRLKLADKKLLYFISGLVLVFVTIAIPVQLDGNWVTLLWAGEAALLFWIGRTKNISIYESLSYPLIFLAFFSIIHDWFMYYGSYYPEHPETRITPIFNIYFLSSIFVIACFGWITYLNQNRKYIADLESKKEISTLLSSYSLKILSFVIPAILIFTIYYTFRIEIETYWNQLYLDSEQKIYAEGQQNSSLQWNQDLNCFKSVWIINYTLFFVTILSWINFKKIKNIQFGWINLGLIFLSILTFLIVGLYDLSELRESYLMKAVTTNYEKGIFYIGIRYISIAFVVTALYACYVYIRQDFVRRDIKIAFDLLLHISILWIASSELIHWMDIAHSTQSYKLGLSILWGVYSLLIIALGIWKKKQYLRIGAISLFGLTLFKLFFYDISHLDTISKTIVFVSLGILLLIISFLYNKYKNIISDEI